MPIIDEEGRLFGTINVVDALAVLLILAVAIAGVTLVVGDSGGNLETRYVTVDFGSQPEHVLEEFDEGDSASAPNARGNLTVTDTYFTPSESGGRAFARLAVHGVVTGESFTYDGAPLRLGRTLDFETEEYSLKGTVQNVGGNLSETTELVLVTDVVDSRVAERIEENDEYRITGEPIATVENVAVYGTSEPDRKRVYVGLTVQALGIGERAGFGPNRSLREGVTLPFRTNTYEFRGEIVRLGGLVETGQATERTVELQMRNVPPERANSVQEGLTETNAGQTVAEVTGVEVEPAVVTLTSDSGNIYEREHPVNKTVTLTVDLQVREEDSGIRFKGQTIQEGNVVILDLGTTTIRATVTDLDPR